MQKLICDNITELLEVFSSQGHSGTTAPEEYDSDYVLGVFEKLAKFDPLGPLTGDEEEWGEPFDHDGAQQNKRDSSVFRNADGTAYWLYGKIFRDPDGPTYTSGDSRVDITFPWTKPESEYIDVPEQAD